jgi:type II secretory pathway pseudopilin PulG
LIVVLSLLIAVAGIGLVAWMWWTHGRDREYLTQYYLTNDPRERAEPLFHHDPVVVEFEPPQNMRPAQLGLILDESADSKDVTATIVDLAVGGFMTINEIPGTKDWQFTWKGGGNAAVLLPYEKTILDGIFAGRQEVKLSELRGAFAPTLKTAERQVYQDAMTRKLFTTRPDYARAGWGCLGIGLIGLGCAATYLLGVAFGWGIAGVAVVVVGMVLMATFHSMPQRSAGGRELLQHTLGFRLYMTTAEKYRQQFAAKAQIFTQLLPYAIVFGCVSLWAKAFEGIDTSASNSWYVGNAPFQAALLASSLESMNASISSAITYTPPSAGSSSGFGGGGFSGGGGGGGGGGSW